jgi:hypothetical protein
MFRKKRNNLSADDIRLLGGFAGDLTSRFDLSSASTMLLMPPPIKWQSLENIKITCLSIEARVFCLAAIAMSLKGNLLKNKIDIFTSELEIELFLHGSHEKVFRCQEIGILDSMKNPSPDIAKYITMLDQSLFVQFNFPTLANHMDAIFEIAQGQDRLKVLREVAGYILYQIEFEWTIQTNDLMTMSLADILTTLLSDYMKLGSDMSAILKDK